MEFIFILAVVLWIVVMLLWSFPISMGLLIACFAVSLAFVAWIDRR